MQAFPKVHQTAVQAADALHILSKQGPVEVHDFAKRITTGVHACVRRAGIRSNDVQTC